MKTFALIIVSFMLLCGAGCTKGTQEGVQIRIRNLSMYNYTDVTVNTGSNQRYYGSVQSHMISDYMQFDYAYRYAYITLKINGETLALQPIDYVGEEKLSKGKYTYEIDANIAQKSLSINLVKD